MFILDGASRNERYEIRELVPALREDPFSEMGLGEIRLMVLKGYYLRGKAEE